MARSPEQIVRDFSAAFARKDVAYIMGALTDDIVYANVPIPAMHGKEAVRQFLVPSLGKTDKLEFIMVNIATAVDGRTVLTERIDVFTYGNNQVSIPLMGIFVLRGELIAEWRDYADIGSFVKQMAAIGQTPGVSTPA
jgi:limonene-1,2-epoxide hydrolase